MSENQQDSNEFQEAADEAVYRLTARGIILGWALQLLEKSEISPDFEAVREEVMGLEALLFEHGYWTVEVGS